MSVYERSRHQLYQWLPEVLGAEATILMEHLPPGGTTRIATKDDLKALENRLLAEIHRATRHLTLSLTTIMAVLNAITFTALDLC